MVPRVGPIGELLRLDEAGGERRKDGLVQLHRRENRRGDRGAERGELVHRARSFGKVGERSREHPGRYGSDAFGTDKAPVTWLGFSDPAGRVGPAAATRFTCDLPGVSG